MPGTVASVGDGCFAMVSAGEGEEGGEVDEDRCCSFESGRRFGEAQQQQFQVEQDEDDIRWLALA